MDSLKMITKNCWKTYSSCPSRVITTESLIFQDPNSGQLPDRHIVSPLAIPWPATLNCQERLGTSPSFARLQASSQSEYETTPACRVLYTHHEANQPFATLSKIKYQALTETIKNTNLNDHKNISPSILNLSCR